MIIPLPSLVPALVCATVLAGGPAAGLPAPAEELPGPRGADAGAPGRPGHSRGEEPPRGALAQSAADVDATVREIRAASSERVDPDRAPAAADTGEWGDEEEDDEAAAAAETANLAAPPTPAGGRPRQPSRTAAEEEPREPWRWRKGPPLAPPATEKHSSGTAADPGPGADPGARRGFAAPGPRGAEGGGREEALREARAGFPKNSNYSAYPFETALDLMAFVRNRTRFWTDWYAPDEYNGSIPVGPIKSSNASTYGPFPSGLQCLAPCPELIDLKAQCCDVARPKEWSAEWFEYQKLGPCCTFTHKQIAQCCQEALYDGSLWSGEVPF